MQRDEPSGGCLPRSEERHGLGIAKKGGIPISKEKRITEISKKEIIWQHIQAESGCAFLITSDRGRDWHFLYQQVDGGYVLISKAHTPKDFGNIIDKSCDVREKVGARKS